MKYSFKYLPEIFLLLLQFTPFAVVGTVMASIYIFYKVAFQVRVDILSLFLLLLPSIALKQNDIIFQIGQNQFEDSGWLQVFIPTLKSSVIIGHLAVSPHLFAALAVPIRLIKFKKQVRVKYVLLWTLALLISIFGLYLSQIHGYTSEGGITVGLRIVLSMGVLLIPVFIEQKELYHQLSGLMKLSIVLFLFGLLNAHWLFVTVAFPAIILFSDENRFWKFLSLSVIGIIAFLGSTFTLKFILIFSILLVWFHKIKGSSNINGIFRLRINPVLLIAYLFFPIYIVILTVSQKIMPIAQAIGSDRFLSKLFDDRGTLWLFSLDLIQKSNFFIVPAGRDIITYDYGIIGEKEWGAGAHNIFLEIARQNGTFVFLIIFFLIAVFFREMNKTLLFQNKLLKNASIGFIAVYMVFGLTGNSLIYDGVGFLFWLIFSQLIKSSKLN